MVPVAQHAEALERPSRCRSICDCANARHSARNWFASSFGARAAVLLLDLQLDRQAVAVPAGDVRRVVAVHRARLHDEVFQDLVDRVADVNLAVRVRRAVVQHEARPAARDLAQLLIKAAVFPVLQHGGLAVGEVRLHREVGLRAG